MAKGKHATALFEVIHSGRYPHKEGSLRTPKWWFKRKPAAAAGAPAAESSDADPTANVSATDGAIVRDAPSGEEAPATARSSNVDARADAERHHITFKVTYSSAIVTAFAVVVVVALAYVVGRKVSTGPAPAIATETTEQLRSGQPQPGVLDLGSPTSSPRTPDATPPRTGDNAAGAPGTTGAGGAPPVNDNGASSNRTVHLNYVVVQSYPDEKSANEARDALIKAGIPCTIEQGLRGLKPDWYSVVGTQGFQRISSAEYQAYVGRINQVSQQFAQGKRSFKAFQPMAYKWDKSK